MSYKYEIQKLYKETVSLKAELAAKDKEIEQLKRPDGHHNAEQFYEDLCDKCSKNVDDCGMNPPGRTSSCIGFMPQDEISRLRAENKQLRSDLEAVSNREGGCCPEDVGFDEYIRRLQDELAEARRLFNDECAEHAGWRVRGKKAEAELDAKDDALQRLRNWAQAYPIVVFPKPDLKKAHEVLKAAGMNLDAVSADNMRHVITQVQKIVEQALKGE